MKSLKVCFFCRVKDVKLFEWNEYYSIDIKILRDLGYEVVICTSPLHIPVADLYVVWWWTWAIFPLIIAKVTRKQIIVVGTFDHVQTDGSLEFYPHRPALHKAAIKMVLQHADANVVVSMDQYNHLIEHFTVNNLRCVPHVIDTEYYQKQDTHDAGNMFLLTFCYMNLGNAKRKCVDQSIKAMSIVHRTFPDCKLVICGKKGTDYDYLCNLVDDLNAHSYIEFLGVVDKKQKVSLMSSCTAYLQPTLGEGFGVAILEAMSCSAPVITSPVGAVPEVVGDCALFVDGSDINGIADGIINLINNRQLRCDLGANARLRAVELFSYERRKNDFSNIIDHVVSG